MKLKEMQVQFSILSIKHKLKILKSPFPLSPNNSASSMCCDRQMWWQNCGTNSMSCSREPSVNCSSKCLAIQTPRSIRAGRWQARCRYSSSCHWPSRRCRRPEQPGGAGLDRYFQAALRPAWHPRTGPRGQDRIARLRAHDQLGRAAGGRRGGCVGAGGDAGVTA